MLMATFNYGSPRDRLHSSSCERTQFQADTDHKNLRCKNSVGKVVGGESYRELTTLFPRGYQTKGYLYA